MNVQKETLKHSIEAFLNPRQHWKKYHNRCYTNDEFRLPENLNSHSLRKAVRHLANLCNPKESKSLVMNLVKERLDEKGRFRFDGYLLTAGQFLLHLERELRHARIHRA